MSWKALARTDLNTLVILSALLEEENVSRAAVRPNLSQPAVSRALARLRDQFQDPLFTRSRHGMTPTPRAEALRRPLNRLLDELSVVLQPPGFDPASSRRRFTIATTDYGVHALLSPIIGRWRPEPASKSVTGPPGWTTTWKRKGYSWPSAFSVASRQPSSTAGDWGVIALSA